MLTFNYQKGKAIEMNEISIHPDYFENRGIAYDYYKNYKMPSYLKNCLPENKESKILDIGCGFGQALCEIKKIGYTNIKGIDILSGAVEFVKSLDINVEKIDDLGEFCLNSAEQYDFILMSHVLEHIEKDKIIKILSLIKTNLLKSSGSILIVVPNAQSNTDCYWAYEDFTHSFLFTAGSLQFVLKSAGFSNIRFIDVKGVDDSPLIKKLLKLFFLKIYVLNKRFWNIATSSFYHKPSPVIYTFDLKALASND